MADPGPIELVDAGEGRRLERFGARLVDRPAPTAVEPRRDPAAWEPANLRFDPGEGWLGEPAALESWQVTLDGLTLELRPTASGGLGLYPEHALNLAWLARQIAARADQASDQDPREPPAVLNLFAHTGLATLAAARAGAAVAHIDGARSTVAWARRNAELSGLAERPIRWLVDDAAAFVAREARRGRRYDGIVLDPPSYGHAGARRWRLADELPGLLAACRTVATDDAFVLLTAHTAGLDGHDLRQLLRFSFDVHRGAGLEVARQELTAASGARLELGWSVRLGSDMAAWPDSPSALPPPSLSDRLPVDGR
jgi:23S rRNA (cytosine1962-C5)-methyltransferase